MYNTFRNVYRSVKELWADNRHRELLRAFPVTVGAKAVENQTVTNTTTEASTVLSVELEGGKTYAISVWAPATIPVTNGIKIDFAGGGVTATSFVARATFWTDNAAPQYESIIALTTSVSSIIAGTGFSVEGTLVVNTGGTLVLRFAQQVATGNTVLLAGARIVAVEL